MKINKKYPVLLCAVALVFVLTGGFANAQSRVSADVSIKRVSDGNSISLTKCVYCKNDGSLVVRFTRPQEFFLVTNTIGESKVYNPASNEVIIDNDKTYVSTDELLSIFLMKRSDDLGLKEYGYTLVDTRVENGLVIKKYKSPAANIKISSVELVFENYLPIYCGYYDDKGIIVRKVYLSNYSFKRSFAFPQRVTQIEMMSNRDSVMTREVYSNIQFDGNDQYFDYKVPASAKKVLFPEKK